MIKRSEDNRILGIQMIQKHKQKIRSEDKFNSPDEATMRIWRRGEKMRGSQESFIFIAILWFLGSLTITIWQSSLFAILFHQEDMFCIVRVSCSLALIFSPPEIVSDHKQRQHRLDLELIIRIKASQSLTKPLLSLTEKSRIKIGHFLTEHSTKSESEGCSVQSK